MRVTKASQAGEETRLGPEELEQINRLARRELTAGEVYAFSVRLCDKEVDRVGERFEPETLEELAGLFVGKCGIFDHQWSAKGQAARIYRTERVREPEKLTKAGDGDCWLCLYDARREQPGPGRGERGGHQERGERGLRGGAQ